MTVAAYDGKSIAADSQWTDGSMIWAIKPKLQEWSKGWWTSAGRVSDAELFRHWLEDPAIKIKVHKSFEAFFSADGKVYYVDAHLIPIQPPHSTAIGDGAQLAIALMREGFTAKQAVEIVCRNNVWCDYPVTVVDVA